MNDWMEKGLAYFSSNTSAVFVVAAVIVAVALERYLRWFRPPVEHLLATLKQLSDALQRTDEGWQVANERARAAVKAHPVVAAAWGETEKRVISLPYGARTVPAMFGSPRDLWSANQLLAPRLNVALAEAVPNLLVGVGLLFTFVFLTLALMQATSALVSQSGQQADLLQATRGLLSAAGAKFVTSLAGLLASIVWTIKAKESMAKVQQTTENVLDRLGHLVPTAGGEMAMFAQLTLAQELQRSSGLHVEVSRDLVNKTEDGLGLSEELLEQAREQTGTLKRFETDLAVSLAGAITQAFTPQMEAMTVRLVSAIEGLSEKIGTMNEDALQKMLSDFGAMLKQATDSEMAQLRSALEGLASRLDMAGQVIGKEADGAAKALDGAGAALATRLEQSSTNLTSSLESAGALLDSGAATAAKTLEGAGAAFATRLEQSSSSLMTSLETASSALGSGAANAAKAIDEASAALVSRVEIASTSLEGAAGSVKTAMNDLGATITEAAELGKQGTAVFRSALESSDTTLERLSGVSAHLGEAAAGMQRASSQVAHAVDNVEELSREQRVVLSAVKEAAPNALATVQRFSEVLDDSARQTAHLMAQTRQSMESTAVSLSNTVASITEGVSSYSGQVADLHRSMDEHLSKAVGSLNKGVMGLEDAIEELGEVLSSQLARA